VKRLLVVGAGIGGLTLACALRDSDWEVDVVERAERVEGLGVGIVLHPNGMRVLDALGLADEVARRGNPLRRLEILRGDQCRSIKISDAWPGARHPTTAIRRSDLHDVLGRAALRQPGSVRIRSGTRLEGLDDVRSDRPVASFADGARQRYDLVVGADGVHSTVRRLLDPAARAVRTPLFYTRFVADSIHDLDDDTWRTTERHDAAHGFIPLGGGRAHCFVQQRLSDAAAKTDETPTLGEESLQEWDPVLAEAFARAEDPHRGFAHLVRPVAWGDGSCVLVGDAAHAVSPTLSQGGSLAAEDALVLARSLRGPIPEDGIAAYRRARHQRTLWAYRMSLAQVNGLARRTMPTWTIDTAAATRHLAQIYEPLLADPLAPPEDLPDLAGEV